MTRAEYSEMSFSKRGYWLRCFLNGTIAALCLCGVRLAEAKPQLQVPGAFRVSQFQGVVVTPEGTPVSGAEVSLLQDEKTVAVTRTDSAGRFRIDHMSGHYTFHIQAPHYPLVNREVVVRFELATDFKRNKLYVILGPGACSDNCSSVFTGKKDFERIIRRNTRHNR